MKLITDLSHFTSIKNSHSVITLGNFDGLHLGHQKLVKMVIDRAEQTGGQSVVFTFQPHPLKILAPNRCPPLLSLYEEKVELFRDMGIDLLIMAPFTHELSSLLPEDFVRNVLHNLLRVKAIIVGNNYRFGRGRRGNVMMLRKLGQIYGFDVLIVDEMTINGEIISSTKIRRLLIIGEVEHAARLLGRYYAITGTVVQGDKRGRLLGFPTANIKADHELLPEPGVYVSRIKLHNTLYNGVVSIGYRPTFNKNIIAVEAYIFDFNKNIYGEKLTLFFLNRLREEKKFDNVTSLIIQIREDVEKARELLADKNKITVAT
jgi:riboflavin kinase/FMN adenylyltransferase